MLPEDETQTIAVCLSLEVVAGLAVAMVVVDFVVATVVAGLVVATVVVGFVVFEVVTVVFFAVELLFCSSVLATVACGGKVLSSESEGGEVNIPVRNKATDKTIATEVLMFFSSRNIATKRIGNIKNAAASKKKLE